MVTSIGDPSWLWLFQVGRAELDSIFQRSPCAVCSSLLPRLPLTCICTFNHVLLAGTALGRGTESAIRNSPCNRNLRTNALHYGHTKAKYIQQFWSGVLRILNFPRHKRKATEQFSAKNTTKTRKVNLQQTGRDIVLIQREIREETR